MPSTYMSLTCNQQHNSMNMLHCASYGKVTCQTQTKLMLSMLPPRRNNVLLQEFQSKQHHLCCLGC